MIDKSKSDYVKSQTQFRKHHCHWSGCKEQVPPAMWGCKKHWFMLPKYLRDKIWAAYVPGQEITMTPSKAYLDAANEVENWINKMINNLPAKMLPYKGRMICIDPGSAGSGIAFFAENENKPYFTYVCNAQPKEFPTWYLNCNSILKAVELCIHAYKPNKHSEDSKFLHDYLVFIEEPQYFDSYTGRTAAKSDSLAKLVYFYGRLWEMIYSQFTKGIFAVPILDWKGQLDKAKIAHRVKRAIGEEYKSHSSDAVAIGCWIRGIL